MPYVDMCKGAFATGICGSNPQDAEEQLYVAVKIAAESVDVEQAEVPAAVNDMVFNEFDMTQIK